MIDDDNASRFFGGQRRPTKGAPKPSAGDPGDAMHQRIYRWFTVKKISPAFPMASELTRILCGTAPTVPENVERALEPIRKALSSRGYCGDGGLASMVGRALDEAEDKGARKALPPLETALQQAESFIFKHDDPDDSFCGTLGERLDQVLQTVRESERERLNRKWRTVLEGIGVDVDALALRKAGDTDD